MKTQKPRILIVEDGRDLAFCHLKFRRALSSYVNKKRIEGQILTKTKLVQNIIRTYNYCWTILHKYMLDIPDHTYEKLEELMTEMQYWIYGLPMIDMDNYDPEVEYYRLDYFGRLQYLELNDEMGVEPGELNEQVTEWVVEDFYSAIRAILKNYIPREPGAGGGCPQTRPAKD